MTDKQNEKASRIFDDKELQLKFKEYKPKEYRYHKYDKEKMIVKMSIDSKKIITLVKGRKLFEDLSDEQFQVLN